jgi:hypothetical protein
VRQEIDTEILDRFVQDGRLVLMPTRPAKRLVVLEHVAQSFEPGRTYPEAEVNTVLQGFHADYAALRRYLISAGLLGRADGVYWRTPASVAV